MSDQVPVSSGVLRGSVLGPSLFLASKQPPPVCEMFSLSLRRRHRDLLSHQVHR